MPQPTHRGPVQPNRPGQQTPASQSTSVRQESLESWDIRRARHALQQMPQNSQLIDSELVGTAKKLPMMIRTCGLAQAVAFYEGKGGSHGEIVSACGLWLAHSGSLQPAESSLAETLVGTGSSPQLLRRCTSEVMAYLFWYIRFLDARK